MKTNLDEFFSSNEKAEKEGIWIPVGPEASFKCKMFGGANANKIKQLQVKYLKPYARQIENGLMESEKERSIYVKIFSEACLLDWKGVVDENDQEIPFSLDSAYKLFSDLPKLFDYIVAESTNDDQFREDLGNS